MAGIQRSPGETPILAARNGVVRDTFALALAAAIAQRGVSLSWLHRRLADRATPVSIATLSYWRSGIRHPEGPVSTRAVEEIEDLLGLAVGELMSLLQRSRRTSVEAAAPNPLGDAFIEETRWLRQHLPTVRPVEVRELSTRIDATVDGDGHVVSQRVSMLLQSISDELTELNVGDVSPSVLERTPTLSDLRGADVDRAALHPDGRVWGYRLRLDHTVPIGETIMLEYTLAGLPPVREISHVQERSSRQTLLSVIFPTASRPDWGQVFHQTLDGAEKTAPRPINGSSMFVVEHGFGPGRVGLRWGYRGDAP